MAKRRCDKPWNSAERREYPPSAYNLILNRAAIACRQKIESPTHHTVHRDAVKDANRRLFGLLDHLIGAIEEIRRERQTESFGSLEVDHQLELGRLLDWKVGGLRPL